MKYKLGKLAPKHDKRTLLLANFVSLPVPPAVCDWAKPVKDWGMMGNDLLGDCTEATVGHKIQSWTANNGKEIILPDSAIREAYSRVGGYDPSRDDPTGKTENPTDQGCAVLDVLKDWRIMGVGGHKCDAFAQVDLHNLSLVKSTIHVFGGAYLGIVLPAFIEDLKEGAVWDIPMHASKDDLEPLGGHAIPALYYDKDVVRVITWGATQDMTWAFFRKFCDEAWAVLCKADWEPNSVAPNGLDYNHLRGALGRVTAQAA